MGNIGVIINREFNTRVRKKSFIITTILMPLLMVGLMVLPVALSMMEDESEKQILVVDRSGQIAPGLQSEKGLVFIPEERSYEQIREQNKRPEGVYGILVIGADVMQNPRDVSLYTYESSTMDIESRITKQIERVIEERKLLGYNIENLPQIMAEVKTSVSMQTVQINADGAEKESSSIVAMATAYIFGFMIYMFVLLYGAMVMQGVIEEKSSKVLEIMVSSVRPFDLMMGKIIGIAAVAILQFVIWMVVIAGVGFGILQFFSAELAANAQAMQDMAGGMAAGGMNMDPEALSVLRNALDPAFLLKIFFSFVLYFIGGYLLYSAMFAAIGSAVDDPADAQQLQLPITIPIILALVVLMNVMRNPDGAMGFWFSMIPFTSPVIMMARIPYGVPMWEIALSLALLYASFIAMVWMAGKVYRVGIFMYGKKPTWKELFKWMRYKY